MKVTGHATIKGRGVVTVIDVLPAELDVGSYVSSGHRVWKVLAIETYAMPRSHTNGKPAGLLLQGDRDAPEVCEVLTLLLTPRPRFGNDFVKGLVLPDLDGPAGDCQPNIRFFGTPITIEQAKMELARRQKGAK
jgi:hypothetical protein